MPLITSQVYKQAQMSQPLFILTAVLHIDPQKIIRNHEGLDDR